jgi:hypothetical protein
LGGRFDLWLVVTIKWLNGKVYILKNRFIFMVNKRIISRHFVDNGITNELYEKMQALNEVQESKSGWSPFIAKDKISKSFLEEEATTHSFKIENPGFVGGNKFDSHSKTKEYKKGLKALQNAFRWGYENFSFDNLDESYIKALTGKIEPVFYKKNPLKFRDGGKRILGTTQMPPSYAKIFEEMDNYIESLKTLSKGTDLRDKLETAIFAHLHLVRIHPFEDGNGRTARTLQNIILKKSDLLPPVIYVGERDDYYSHLYEAVNDWRNRTRVSPDEKYKSQGEKAFYNYIAGKISASYDRILNGNH